MIPFYKLERYEGNEHLFELVLMSIVSSYVGEPLHIHAEGLRGTGKTTIMRAAKDILPEITRIKGCIYNCDPDKPHCPHHKGLSPEEIREIGVEKIPMPFLEISHSAKVGTVAGSIDLARLTDAEKPEARLLPGLIPQAHRGIIFIDEINRLADTSPEITDIMLDVMGNKPGHIQIEEAGLPIVDIPVSVSVWAASNPDEEPGPLEEIRRQLSDRFDMVCYMGRPD
ncbi:MAG: magnesium chelatase, partial [Syntrophomonadaceae bacterium]|nr:magnesium chelatase [Syntrophomonadaceae bacterium]